MKTIQNLLLGILLVTCGLSHAQVSVNVNIGTPPSWGPAGYTDVRYYYLPDIETYYDINDRQYIYLTNGKWVRSVTVPSPYRTYDFYNGYKVVMTDYRGPEPYVYYKTYKVKYPKGYKPKHQKTIGVPPGQAKKAMSGKHKDHGGKGKGHGNGKDKH